MNKDEMILFLYNKTNNTNYSELNDRILTEIEFLQSGLLSFPVIEAYEEEVGELECTISSLEETISDAKDQLDLVEKSIENVLKLVEEIYPLRKELKDVSMKKVDDLILLISEIDLESLECAKDGLTNY